MRRRIILHVAWGSRHGKDNRCMGPAIRDLLFHEGDGACWDAKCKPSEPSLLQNPSESSFVPPLQILPHIAVSARLARSFTRHAAMHRSC